MSSITATPIGFGSLLRQWRTARRMSQQQLAIESEVSTRHISYVENGKSSPSREMVLILASALDLPLRERNSLLSTAGFAPIYRETNLSAPEMQPVRHAFDTILAHHEPYPAIVLTRAWDIVSMNNAFMRLFAFFIEPPFDPVVAQNVMHSLFPSARRPPVRGQLGGGRRLPDRSPLPRIDRRARNQREPKAPRCAARVSRCARAHARSRSRGGARVCITVNLEKDGTRLDLFSTLTTLGTPLDVTAQELRIESYFPADEATGEWLRKSAAAAAN